MARLYNTQKVAQNKVSVGDKTATAFTYKGFSSENFKKGYKLYDIDLVKQDIINNFYIRKGEKLHNPDFGTIIWDVIFEPFTEEVKSLVAKDVETIVNYDPRVAVTQVSVDTTDFGMRIEVDLTYLPFNINDKMKFNFDKSTNRIN